MSREVRSSSGSRFRRCHFFHMVCGVAQKRRSGGLGGSYDPISDFPNSDLDFPNSDFRQLSEAILVVWGSYGRSEQLWPFLDPLVVAAGFYGSESSPKVVPIRPETVRGSVFGRVAEKCEGFLQICNF